MALHSLNHNLDHHIFLFGLALGNHKGEGHKGVVGKAFGADKPAVKTVNDSKVAILRRTLLGKTVCYDFKLRIMKVIRYDDMGHRKKNGISSSHSFLKEDGIIPPQWKVRGAANKGFRCMGFWKRSMNDSLA